MRGLLASLRGRMRAGSAIGLLALCVAAVGTWAAVWRDRDPTYELTIESSVGNLSERGRPSTNSVDASVGDTVEYSIQLINVGNSAVENASVTFNPPQLWGASFVADSCAIRAPSGDFVACDSHMRESDLVVPRLARGEHLEVRARYVVDQPPCRAYSFEQSAKGDSLESSESGTAQTRVHYVGLPASLPRCDVPARYLLEQVPAATRPRCETWRDGSFEKPIMAGITCDGDETAEFLALERYDRPANARREYDRYTGDDTPIPCAGTDGVSAIAGFYGRYEFRCSADGSDGGARRARIDWVDRDQGLIGYARAADADVTADALMTWWFKNGIYYR